ncbi:MAG: hypothetical protein CMJ58_26475 [Planctomycetaceae bacterium]|nr:hypothetical protein [Planctomycetaceae bacterium]
MKHYRYSVEGMLLSEDKCTIDEYDEYIKRIDDGQSIWIPTHWWLLPFTNPFYSWVLAGTGLVTLMLADKYAKSNGDTNAVDFSDANPST